jgi:ATP citrate (pro-S)-lyase
MLLFMLQVKLIVVLGEIGGRDEYSLVDALKAGQIQKPVVAWVSGTCATLFKSEVQFGHAVSENPTSFPTFRPGT